MRNPLRRLVLAIAVAATLAVPGVPAQAEGAVFFTASIHINCFGCGTSPGTASLCVTGETDGSAWAGCGFAGGRSLIGEANGIATFTAVEDNDPLTCVISGTATGTSLGGGTLGGLATGGFQVAFNWTRVGDIAVITTTGTINGVGTAVFLVTSPSGVPCRSAVDAIATGFVAGV